MTEELRSFWPGERAPGAPSRRRDAQLMKFWLTVRRRVRACWSSLGGTRWLFRSMGLFEAGRDPVDGGAPAVVYGPQCGRTTSAPAAWPMFTRRPSAAIARSAAIAGWPQSGSITMSSPARARSNASCDPRHSGPRRRRRRVRGRARGARRGVRRPRRGRRPSASPAARRPARRRGSRQGREALTASGRGTLKREQGGDADNPQAGGEVLADIVGELHERLLRHRGPVGERFLRPEARQSRALEADPRAGREPSRFDDVPAPSRPGT